MPRYARPYTVAALLAIACTAPIIARAESAAYALDPVHTRVMFALSHDGYSQAIGTVSGSTGTLLFDPDDWRSAQLQATIPIDRLDLGDAKWNRAALDDNLLDADDHPTATFISTRVEPVDPTHAIVHGLLTLRGVEKEVALDVTLNQVKRYPLPPFRRTAGFSATTTISRRAFGIDAWSRLIGDEVTLRIEAEATRTHGDAGLPSAPAASGSNTRTGEDTAPTVASPELRVSGEPDPGPIDPPEDETP